MPNKEFIELEKELEGIRLLPPGSELVSALIKIAGVVLNSDLQKAEVYALEAQDLAEKLELPVKLAQSYRTLGMINREVGNFSEAISFCRKSMEMYKNLEDNDGMASVHSTIAMTYRAQGLIDKALEHYHECLRKKQECSAPEDDIALGYFNIGSCYSSLFHLEQAQLFYEYAREIWERSDNRPQLAYLYNNFGCLYGRKKELDKAREYFQKALDIRIELENKNGIASTLGNLGNLHEDLDDNESALGFYIRSLELYEEIGNRRGIAYMSSCVGGIYTALGRLDEAESLITRGLSITRKLLMKDWEIHCLEKITDLLEAKGELKKALLHSRELNTCLEEHLNEKSMEKIAGLQVQFETEKKEKEAEIYRLKNVELSAMNDKLRDALAHVKTLQGLLPICASCKKVRNDDGYWQQIELYVSDHSDATFSHGICPECMVKLYGKEFTREQE